jgi:hypothetical protein
VNPSLLPPPEQSNGTVQQDASPPIRPRLSGGTPNIFGQLLPYLSSGSDDDGEEEDVISDNFLEQGEEENVEVRNFRLYRVEPVLFD